VGPVTSAGFFWVFAGTPPLGEKKKTPQMFHCSPPVRNLLWRLVPIFDGVKFE
jgi:hypothetical protein